MLIFVEAILKKFVTEKLDRNDEEGVGEAVRKYRVPTNASAESE